jgi:predicted permease
MIWRDILYALRTLRNKPAFAATAVITLALAIGGNTAMFTVIRTVLLKPLPFQDSDRLVVSGGATPARFAQMRDSAHCFTGLGAYAMLEDLTLSSGGEPEVLKGIRLSANFLQILGVDPIRGRGFGPEEDKAGAAPVAIISSELWQQRFGGDQQIIGRTVTLAATPYTIIGVLPPGFRFPSPGVAVWITQPAECPLFPPKSRPMSPFLTVFGRLKPGISLQQANAELRVIQRQYAMAHPAMLDAKPNQRGEVEPMKDKVVASVRATLWMLLGAVGFVLLIACANVAGLLLARATSRSREFAVRSALGAARIRLAAQLLVESVVLSFAGGSLGVLLPRWSLRAIPLMTSFDLPRAGEIHMDGMVLAFAVGLSVATGLLFGLAPSLSASRPDLIHVLRASGEGANQGTGRGAMSGLNVRSLLLVGQVALSIVLLIGAGLLTKSVSRLRGVDMGFNPSHLLTARISLPPQRYDTDQKRASFFRDLVGKVGSTPGVRSATAAMFLPMTGFAGTPVQDAAKPLVPLNERRIATVVPVTPGYFRTLDIPLKRGRDLGEQDTVQRQRVTIINETLARRFWPAYPAGEDPVGKRIWVGGVHTKPAEIVGIAADVHQNLENTAWPDTVYLAFAQNPQSFALLAVRTEGDPLQLTRAVREQVQAIDRDQPISEVRTMDDLAEEEMGPKRLLMALLGSFALMALLLALIGIYGIIAYSVAQRTQEMGIRHALGAQQSDILRLVVGQGFRLALAGVAVGSAAAFALTRLMASLLFQVSAADPTTFVSVALLFLLVALVASYIPARRATRIDPMAALRN